MVRGPLVPVGRLAYKIKNVTSTDLGDSRQFRAKIRKCRSQRRPHVAVKNVDEFERSPLIVFPSHKTDGPFLRRPSAPRFFLSRKARTQSTRDNFIGRLHPLVLFTGPFDIQHQEGVNIALFRFGVGLHGRRGALFMSVALRFLGRLHDARN